MLKKLNNLPKELLDNISKLGEKEIENLIKEKFKTNSEKDKGEKNKELIKECYLNIIDILKKYCDIKEEYYLLISIWILGTYIHEEFETYPYLFLNAMKGSGKSRTLKLISHLSYDGEVLSSLTEAVLFRTKGTLCIDEFEGITRKGGENLRELLNASYKKGGKVKRMKKKKTMDGEEQVIEEFDTYRPICMANIWGMESVLGDRCITLILERSNKSKITKLMEIFDLDSSIISTKSILKGISENQCSLCSVVTPRNVYIKWNDYIIHYYTNYTKDNNYTNYTKDKLNGFFKKLNDSGINGRYLEISMPLFIIAMSLGDEILNKLIKIIKNIVDDKKIDDFTDNHDVLLIDFVSQELNNNNFVSISYITKKFKEFTNLSDEWINNKWIGRGLKRLALIKEKKRMGRGIEVILNVTKAQEKIKIFK